MQKEGRVAVGVADRAGVEKAAKLAVPHKKAYARDARAAKHQFVGLGVKLQVQRQQLRRGEQQRHRHRQPPAPPPQLAPAALVQPQRHQAAADGDQREDALGHHRRGAEQRAQQQVLQPRLGVMAQPVVTGAHDAAREVGLGAHVGAGQHHLKRRHKHQHCQPGGLAPIKQAGDAVGVIGPEQVEQEARQVVADGVDAAQLEKQRCDPEGKVRFVQPVLPVQHQVDPVAVAHHVLRQRGVSDGVTGVDDGRDQADGIDQQRQKDQPADEGEGVQAAVF